MEFHCARARHWKNLANGKIVEIADKKIVDYKIPSQRRKKNNNLRLLFVEFEKQIPRRIEINSQINIENRLLENIQNIVRNKKESKKKHSQF